MTNREAIEQLEIYKSFCAEVNIKGITSYNMAIKALEEQDKHSWIPVSERLPEMKRQVVCCNADGNVFTSCMTYKAKCGNKIIQAVFGQHYDVVAWMPLPEPYKE